MKNCFSIAIGALGLISTSQAGLAGMQGGVMLGGGYLEEPGAGYFFGQLRGTFYEDDAVAHTAFFEFLGHRDDAVLEFARPGGGTFFEDGDITFSNFTLNYELEAKLSETISFYAGAGAGIEYVSIDDRFDISLDSDTNFVAQFFAGFRANFSDGFMAQAGARYLMRDDFSLLGDQFVTDDSWAFEASIGFKF